MTNTTYYNLNIVEGTDIVNPLTVDNPNYEKIDETMHNNAVSGVTLATEIANATVHAITRENSECAVIRFIATSNWKAGDTITVDGVPVTALLPSGETLPDGAYVINANVLCILTGTNLTIYAERKKTENANEITYNDTNVGAQLDKINSNLAIIKNDVITNYEKVNTGSFKKGNIQYINCSVQIPIDVNSEGTYFTIAYAPENVSFQHTFCGVINYANRIIPALFRITFEKNIQLFISTEITNLGSVNVTAYINTDYMIAG